MTVAHSVPSRQQNPFQFLYYEITLHAETLLTSFPVY
jgi:hypothetical protein